MAAVQLLANGSIFCERDTKNNPHKFRLASAVINGGTLHQPESKLSIVSNLVGYRD